MEEKFDLKPQAKKFGKLLYDSAYWTIWHDGIEHAGYMAFLGLLSFFPFVILFVSLSGLIGPGVLSAEFVAEIQRIIPENIMQVLLPRVDEITSGPPQDVLAVSIIGVLWTASSVVEGTRTILNRVYHVHTPPSYVWRRLLSVLQMLVFTGILTIVMILLIIGPILLAAVKAAPWMPPQLLNALQIMWNSLRYGVSGGMLFIVIAGSYYSLPNIKQRWLWVLPGTLVVLIGWFCAAGAFSLYLQRFHQINVVYGSLAGIIAALVFMYVISVIYIFGAELNYHLDKAYGLNFEEKEKKGETPVKKTSPKKRRKQARAKLAEKKKLPPAKTPRVKNAAKK